MRITIQSEELLMTKVVEHILTFVPSFKIQVSIVPILAAGHSPICGTCMSAVCRKMKTECLAFSSKKKTWLQAGRDVEVKGVKQPYIKATSCCTPFSTFVMRSLKAMIVSEHNRLP
jgi:hypothetical protein